VTARQEETKHSGRTAEHEKLDRKKKKSDTIRKRAFAPQTEKSQKKTGQTRRVGLGEKKKDKFLHRKREAGGEQI